MTTTLLSLGQADTIPCPPPESLLLELLDGEPLAKAERLALEFHADCMAALDGQRLKAGLFTSTNEFRAISSHLRSRVGVTMANRIMSDWFVDNKNLFV